MTTPTVPHSKQMSQISPAPIREPIGGKSILGQDSNVDNRFFIIIQQPCVGIYKFYVKQTH